MNIFIKYFVEVWEKVFTKKFYSYDIDFFFFCLIFCIDLGFFWVLSSFFSYFMNWCIKFGFHYVVIAEMLDSKISMVALKFFFESLLTLVVGLFFLFLDWLYKEISSFSGYINNFWKIIQVQIEILFLLFPLYIYLIFEYEVVTTYRFYGIAGSYIWVFYFLCALFHISVLIYVNYNLYLKFCVYGFDYMDDEYYFKFSYMISFFCCYVCCGVLWFFYYMFYKGVAWIIAYLWYLNLYKGLSLFVILLLFYCFIVLFLRFFIYILIKVDEKNIFFFKFFFGSYFFIVYIIILKIFGSSIEYLMHPQTMLVFSPLVLGLDKILLFLFFCCLMLVVWGFFSEFFNFIKIFLKILIKLKK